MRFFFSLLLWQGAALTLAVGWQNIFAGEAKVLRIDFGRTNGEIRPLHGINKGPLGPGGLLDLTAEHRAMGVPVTRLHDCYWPNPYVVDVHAVFPDFKADPMLSESYDFQLTDEYIAAVRATGAEIVYRLGESIEHTSVKRFAHPPADFEKWAAVCLGIIRHYNEGWANGFQHKIRYWEIWNEPENRPAMWSGSDEDYFRLYRVAARAIKNAFPELKVGGPGVGASGRFVNEVFQPTEFVVNFLKTCRVESLPLDFFSWHCYTADPEELVLRARAIRRLLDDYGFAKTESHLNEWNYLPGNSWTPMARNSPAPVRQKYYEEMFGASGAVFVASSLIALQDAPLDVANFFHGEVGAFGLFNEYGVPQKNYYAMRAFQELVTRPRRASVEGGKDAGLAVAAGLARDDRSAAVLISNPGKMAADTRIEMSDLPWSGEVRAVLRKVDATNDFAVVQSEILESSKATLEISLAAESVLLVEIVQVERARNEGPKLQVVFPPNRLVFQRGLDGKGFIPVKGVSTAGATVEARLVPVNAMAREIEWRKVAVVDENGDFAGRIEAREGWYQLELRTSAREGKWEEATVERVGVGEVFVVAGHSVAQGGDLNLPGADDRVNTVAFGGDRRRAYEQTGEAKDLPELAGTQFSDGVEPAPFGHGTYFWARFGELVAQQENVPVMIFNAGFGGTSLEHWAKSARGERFEHSFVKSTIRMPYINLKNALARYATVTGVRAVLADQGQNDAGETNAGVVFGNYRTWVEEARKDLGFAELAVVVNRQTPYRERTAIRAAQERVIREVPHCFAGPDYDRFADEDRPDRIHLSESGAEKAARFWAEALDGRFFREARPYVPR